MANVNDVSDLEAIRLIPASELISLQRFFYLQSLSPNGVPLDYLPYTDQLRWMLAEMTKRFPNSRWSEKLICRTLLRLRRLESKPADYPGVDRFANSPSVRPITW